MNAFTAVCLVLVLCFGAPTSILASVLSETKTAAQSSEGVSLRGIVSCRLASGGVFLIRPQEGATPINVTSLLDAEYGAGTDGWLNISPDGRWLLLETERFGCDGWPCMARLSVDLSQTEVVQPGGSVAHADSFAAIAPGGATVVYPATDGPHDVDLYATTRGESGWSAPLLLTQNSSFPRNEQPAISGDGQTVLFNCKDLSAPDDDSICEVGLDGTGFRVVATPDDAPAGVTTPGLGLHHPDYAPDGSIVYEGDWGGETLYRLAPGSSTPVAVNTQYNNDNSPCVLPNGAIASLWLDRPGGQGVHELKIMDADGANGVVLLPDVDVFDLGLGCGVDRFGSEGKVLPPLHLLLKSGQ